jgi:hypothetical protein
MENTEVQKQAHKWLNVPIIATITRVILSGVDTSKRISSQ